MVTLVAVVHGYAPPSVERGTASYFKVPGTDIQGVLKWDSGIKAQVCSELSEYAPRVHSTIWAYKPNEPDPNRQLSPGRTEVDQGRVTALRPGGNSTACREYEILQQEQPLPLTHNESNEPVAVVLDVVPTSKDILDPVYRFVFSRGPDGERLGHLIKDRNMPTVPCIYDQCMFYNGTTFLTLGPLHQACDQFVRGVSPEAPAGTTVTAPGPWSAPCRYHSAVVSLSSPPPSAKPSRR